jgi:hypothetical protein
MRLSLAVLSLLALTIPSVYGQGNYEVQVYGSETVAPGSTMVELHSNFTVDGSTVPAGSKSMFLSDGTYPTNHQEHETVEITQGWTPWFETGFYIFTSAGPGSQGYQWVGDHFRPRVRVPDSWKWPVGVSLSLEVGYQRAVFSADTWTLEIRPIIDKQLGRWYLALNPTLDRSFHGPSVNKGLEFSPNVKVAYGVNKKLQLGFEYYGSAGDITGFDPVRDQQQQFVPALDYDFGPNWEFNFGVGIGATSGTDHLLVKAIVGRRFNLFGPKTGSNSTGQTN